VSGGGELQHTTTRKTSIHPESPQKGDKLQNGGEKKTFTSHRLFFLSQTLFLIFLNRSVFNIGKQTKKLIFRVL
jgi:hypothetical protein